ncbi:MAG: HD domain-containing protein [Acidobacteriota bacterium]|nr:HD domain-containing protein [Acidobacteriota bacterium]
MFEYQDSLARLAEAAPLRDKLESIHSVLRRRHAFVDRIAVAIHDPETDLLKTFLASSTDANPLRHYQAKLADCTSLLEIVERRRPRVVNDLESLGDEREHSRLIAAEGYESSYTLPILMKQRLFGFVFFDSCQAGVFTAKVLPDFDLFGHFISLVIVNEVSAIRTLLAAIRTARDMTRQRDAETGRHVDRMARFSRLIAIELAERHGFDDEYIEHVFMFAPLHDIGKIGVADRVLLKPGRLDEDEVRLMRTHVDKGRELVDSMLENFGLDSFQHVEMLLNIVQHHHEAPDGSGYPHGLRGSEIPIEARIVAVADVFDALTSARPYKAPWTNEEAFAALRRFAGSALDDECVEALAGRSDTVREIQEHFAEVNVG